MSTQSSALSEWLSTMRNVRLYYYVLRYQNILCPLVIRHALGRILKLVTMARMINN